MIIELTTGYTYDLSQENEKKNLNRYVSVLKSRKKKEELDNIAAQLVTKQNDLSLDMINPIYYRITGKFLPKETLVNTVSTPEISNHSLTEATTITDTNQHITIENKLHTIQTEGKKLENGKHQSTQHSNIANEPIHQETLLKEDGETSFQELYAYLMADLKNYTGNANILAMYTSIVVNFFAHTATFTPTNGHGKAPKREFDNKTQLQYARSQGNHANATLFRNLIKKNGETKQSHLPFNNGFIKLIDFSDFSKKICTDIKKIDPQTGYVKPNKSVNSYVSTKIAHAGARKNNFSTLLRGMEILTKDLKNEDAIKHIKERITSISQPSKKITLLNNEELTSRIQALIKRHNKKGSLKIFVGYFRYRKLTKLMI